MLANVHTFGGATTRRAAIGPRAQSATAAKPTLGARALPIVMLMRINSVILDECQKANS